MRKRPLNKKELAKNEEDIIETYSNSLVVHETKHKVEIYRFSSIFQHRLEMLLFFVPMTVMFIKFCDA